MSGQDPMLDRDDVLLRLLADLEREAEVDGVRVELFVVGDAAMVLAYNLDRITGDLGAVFEPKSVVYRLAARVAEQSDLSIDSEWLNDGVKGFMPGADPNATVFLDRPHLSVSIASPRYMFVLKAMAARESDEDDLRVLYRLCEFASASEALDTVETAYPAHPIKPATQYLIEGIAHDTLTGGTDEPRQPAAIGATSGWTDSGGSCRSLGPDPTPSHQS